MVRGLKMRILFLTNESSTVINFRKELIQFLLSKNEEIIVVSGDNKREREIKDLGVFFECVEYSNRSISILENFKLKKKFKDIIKKYSPDILFTFQAKPNMLGCVAGKKAGVNNIFAMVEGLGDPFQPKTFKQKIVKFIVTILYKKAFKIPKKVFFLNEDDKAHFLENKIIQSEKVVLLPGIGIDIHKWNIKPLPNNRNVLMISRLLINKGVLDYCEIAKNVYLKDPTVTFYLVGPEGQLTKNHLSKYIDNNFVIYEGETKEPLKYLENCQVFVLPSFREGMPRSIMEAMSIGRPVVASNCIGCKDMVDDNVTGYLSSVGDIDEFANKILKIINNKEIAQTFADNARKKVCEFYDSNIINEQIYNIIKADL